MGDTSIEHTPTNLNIVAYTNEQVVEFGKEIYRLRAYNYFLSHKMKLDKNKELNAIMTLNLKKRTKKNML